MTDDLTRPIQTGQDAETGAPAGEAGRSVQPAPTAEPAPGVDDTPAPAGTPPVVSGDGAASSRTRWAIGLGVAGLAIAVAIAAFIVLGSRPAPEALKYIPSDAAVVAEVRMDLPGDQLQKLGNLLAHFPGFKDQSTLTDKIDESISRLVGQESNGSVDYRTDLKPWLSGPVFAGMWLPSGGDAGGAARGLVSATTTGTVSCDTPFKGQSVTHESYRGLNLFLGPNDMTCVLEGRQALLGDVASVKAGIDAHASGGGMDRKNAYGGARASLQGDQLATFYVDGAAYGSFFSGVGGATPMLADLSVLTGSLPSWAITGIRAEDDALVIDGFTGPAAEPTAGATPGVSLLPLPPAHASAIAPLAPANTLVYAEAQGAGVSLQNLISRLRTIPDLATAFQMLDGAGGADQLVGWVQDVGIIVVNGSGKPTGGIALVAADDSEAAQRVATITGLIALAGLGASGIETHESTIAGVAVTTISITDLGALVPPGQLPPGVELPSDAKVEFSIAAKGRVILLGTGEDFMTAVLNTQPGAGLADQAFYKQATSRALANSRMSLYLGVRDLVSFAEPFIPEADKASWESDIKPYAAPFQAVSITSTTEASGSHSRLTITVTQP
jgi:Protein of unknown function (DUF3352)